MPTLPDLLRQTIEMNASDLHLTAGSPPQVRVDGELRRLDLPELTPSDTKQYAYSVLTDAQKKRFEEALELDFSFGIRSLARFRCNVFNQRGAVAAVYRVIIEHIRGFKELALPEVIAGLADRPRGLVLVTGPPAAARAPRWRRSSTRSTGSAGSTSSRSRTRSSTSIPTNSAW
jgi:twitching motility protein PilT